MIDAAHEYAERGFKTWFITIRPSGFISGGERPAMAGLLPEHRNLNLIAPLKSRTFELGTKKGRSIDYAISVIKNVPAGTPVILSDDTAIWTAGKLISRQYPVIGVLHSDDEVYYALYKEYGKYLSSIVAVSERIRKKALKTDQLDKIRVIPCSLRLPEYKLSRENSQLNLLWAGRIEERQKRVSDIPRIAKKLLDEKMDFHWTISGHGDDLLLKEEIYKNGLVDNFTFTGWINREALYGIMDNSDLLVLTSNFEGMSVVVMEAISKGLGVVSTRVSGVEDLEMDDLSEEALALYDIGNIDQAVAGIKKLASIPEAIRIKASRKLAEKYYSIQSCINKYNVLISNLDFNISDIPASHLKLMQFIEKVKSIFISKARYMKYKLAN
jgi:glycosyltransferase involved in cell wall biosynthesis